VTTLSSPSLAHELADTGQMDVYQHGDSYTVNEWQVILEEARAVALAMLDDPDYEQQQTDMDDEELAGEITCLEEQADRLEQAISMARSHGDALGVRIAAEKLRALKAAKQG
jgi:hypothetical protein